MTVLDVLQGSNFLEHALELLLGMKGHRLISSPDAFASDEDSGDLEAAITTIAEIEKMTLKRFFLTYASSSRHGLHVVLNLLAITAVLNVENLDSVLLYLVVLEDFLKNGQKGEPVVKGCQRFEWICLTYLGLDAKRTPALGHDKNLLVLDLVGDHFFS